jgi:hypothetical protein
MFKAFKTAGCTVTIGLLLAGAAYAQTSPAPKPGAGALKMTQAECQSLWNKLDASKAGSVSEAQAKAYVIDFKSVDANSDGKLSQTEFQAGCEKGQVHSSATTGTGSGTSGSAIPKK